MTEKILNEFAVRLNKSRTQLADVCSQVDSLRKEASQLQKQLDGATKVQKHAQQQQEELKVKYIAAKCQNEEENEKFLAEQNELKLLRKKKIEVTKKKEMSEKDCEKLSNELQQSIADRKELEAMAARLNQQLEMVTQEKLDLQKEYGQNQVSYCFQLLYT